MCSMIFDLQVYVLKSEVQFLSWIFMLVEFCLSFKGDDCQNTNYMYERYDIVHN